MFILKLKVKWHAIVYTHTRARWVCDIVSHVVINYSAAILHSNSHMLPNTFELNWWITKPNLCILCVCMCVDRSYTNCMCSFETNRRRKRKQINDSNMIHTHTFNPQLFPSIAVFELQFVVVTMTHNFKHNSKTKYPLFTKPLKTKQIAYRAKPNIQNIFKIQICRVESVRERLLLSFSCVSTSFKDYLNHKCSQSFITWIEKERERDRKMSARRASKQAPSMEPNWKANKHKLEKRRKKRTKSCFGGFLQRFMQLLPQNRQFNSLNIYIK